MGVSTSVDNKAEDVRRRNDIHPEIKPRARAQRVWDVSISEPCKGIMSTSRGLKDDDDRGLSKRPNGLPSPNPSLRDAFNSSKVRVIGVAGDLEYSGCGGYEAVRERNAVFVLDQCGLDGYFSVDINEPEVPRQRIRSQLSDIPALLFQGQRVYLGQGCCRKIVWP